MLELGGRVDVITVLMVFYLFLMVRWQYVKRPLFFLVGAAGIALILAAQFFAWPKTMAVVKIFNAIGTLVAFAGAAIACFGAKLPVNIPGAEMPSEEEKPEA